MRVTYEFMSHNPWWGDVERVRQWLEELSKHPVQVERHSHLAVVDYIGVGLPEMYHASDGTPLLSPRV